MNDIVDEIFVINRDNNTEILKEFDKMMKGFGWQYNRFSAIEGEKISPSNHYCKKYLSGVKSLNNDDIGRLLSHVLIWQKLLSESHLEKILIFEDDSIKYTRGYDITKSVKKFYQYLEDNDIPEPDMLYLSGCNKFCTHYEKVHDSFYKTSCSPHNNAYIITKIGARALLRLTPYNKSIDDIITLAINKKLIDVIVTNPPIYHINDTLENSHSNLVKSSESTNNYWTITLYILIIIMIVIFGIVFWFL